MNGACTGTFFCPAPWGPREGLQGKISLNIIKFQLQSQLQRFLNQTLCVFSYMKDIKHIRQDFHLAAWVMPQESWVMPQEWNLGKPWGVGVCVSYLHEWHMHRRPFLGPQSLGPRGGAKRSNFIKS